MNLTTLMPLIEARNAELAGRLRRLLLLWFGLYILSLAIGNVLSASGLEHVNSMFMFLYLIGVLTLPLNLTFWEGLSVAGFVAGQPGGAPGFDIKDGINKIWEWGTLLIDKGSLYLVFWGAVPYFVLYEVNTTGIVGKVFFLLPLLPPMIYFWTKWSPNTRTGFAVVGYAITIAFLINLSLGIVNTVQRTTADPAAVAVLDYLDQTASVNKQNEQLVAKEIIRKLKAKEALTADEQKAWGILLQEAHAQSLRPASLKQKAEDFVENAKPADSGWWKQHWVTVGGIALAIATAYFLFTRTRVVTAGATPAATPAHGTGSSGKGIRWGWIFVLAFIGWCGYSIYYEVGEPGTMLANADYSRIGKPLEIKNLQNQQICNPESQPKAGKWLVDFPDERYEQAEYSLNRTPYKNMFGFYLEHAAGHLEWLPLTGNAYINNVLVGGKERAVFDGKCFTLTFQVTEEDKRRGVLYGKPICRNDQWCGAASVPTPLLTHLRFYSR